MRIYINGRFLKQQLTGVQRFALEITKRLSRRQIGVVVLVPKGEIVAGDTHSLNIKEIGKRVGHLWEQIDLPAYLRKYENPLLLNLCNTGPLLYNNQIVTIHDVAYLRGNWHSFAFRTLYRMYIPALVKRAKHILTVSHFSKKELQEAYNLDSNAVSVIYNAPIEGIGSTVKMAREKDRYILSVGSLDPRKNLKVLIKAFLELKRSDGLYLYLVGTYNENFSKDKELDALLVMHKERIKFLGYVEDCELIVLYENAACFVFPSLYEGFGLPPIEAMACGCPTIVSHVSSLPEICGYASLYFDPYNVADLIQKLEELLGNEDLQNLLIKEGKQQADKYSWNRSTEIISELVERFL